jgi:hypothetical protein
MYGGKNREGGRGSSGFGLFAVTLPPKPRAALLVDGAFYDVVSHSQERGWRRIGSGRGAFLQG